MTSSCGWSLEVSNDSSTLPNCKEINSNTIRDIFNEHPFVEPDQIANPITLRLNTYLAMLRVFNIAKSAGTVDNECY